MSNGVLSPEQQHLYNAQLLSVQYDKAQAALACRSLRAAMTMTDSEKYSDKIQLMDALIDKPINNVPYNLYQLCQAYELSRKGESDIRWKSKHRIHKLEPKRASKVIGDILEVVGILSARVGKELGVEFDLTQRKEVEAI